MRATVLAGMTLAALGISPWPTSGQPSDPSSFDGHVVEVLSGDTVVVVADGNRYEVRLFGIDAPEEGQDFHDEALRTLSEMALSRRVHVDVREGERRGRVRGLVKEGTQLINRLMVAKGAAWYDPSHAESAALQAVQDSAQKQRLGLWGGDEQPVAPWVYRDQHSEAAKEANERQSHREQQVAAAAAEFLAAWKRGTAPEELLTSKAKKAEHSKKRLPEALEGAELRAERVLLKGNSADVAVSITKGGTTLRGTLRLHSEKKSWLIRAFTSENPPAVLDFENPQNKASKLAAALDSGFEMAQGRQPNDTSAPSDGGESRPDDQGTKSAPPIAVGPDEKDLYKIVAAAGYGYEGRPVLARDLPSFVRFGDRAALELYSRGDQFDRIEVSKAAEPHQAELRKKRLALTGLRFSILDRDDVETSGLMATLDLPMRVRGEKAFHLDSERFHGKLTTMHACEASIRKFAFLTKDNALQPCTPAEASIVQRNNGVLYLPEQGNTTLVLVLDGTLDELKSIARSSKEYAVDIEFEDLCWDRPYYWGYFRRDAFLDADWNCEQIRQDFRLGLGGEPPAYFVTASVEDDIEKVPYVVEALLTRLRVIDKSGRVIGGFGPHAVAESE